MLVGLLTGLLVAGVNIPLANVLSRRVRHPWAFLAVYLVLGLLVVVAGYFLISLVVVPSLQTYGVVALLSYGSVGGQKMRELKAARAQGGVS